MLWSAVAGFVDFVKPVCTIYSHTCLPNFTPSLHPCMNNHLVYWSPPGLPFSQMLNITLNLRQRCAFAILAANVASRSVQGRPLACIVYVGVLKGHTDLKPSEVVGFRLLERSCQCTWVDLHSGTCLTGSMGISMGRFFMKLGKVRLGMSQAT